MLVWLCGVVAQAQIRLPVRLDGPLQTPTPPELTILSPVDEGQTHDTTLDVIAIAGLAADDIALVSVQYRCLTAGCAPAVLTAAGGTLENWTGSITTTTAGLKTVEVVASDGILTDTAQFLINKTNPPSDVTPPTVTITSPNGGNAYTTTELTSVILVTCEDTASICVPGSVRWASSLGGGSSCSQLTTTTFHCSVPHSVGVQMYTIHALDEADNEGTDTQQITRTLPLAISTTTMPAGEDNTAYSRGLSATGGTPPYTWTNNGAGTTLNDADAHCAGLTISSAGVVSGTPTTPGVCSWTAHVSDNAAATDTQALVITIEEEGAAEGPDDYYTEMASHPNLLIRNSLRDQAEIDSLGNDFEVTIYSTSADAKSVVMGEPANASRTIGTCTAGNPTRCTTTSGNEIQDDDLVLVSGHSNIELNGEWIAQRINGTNFEISALTTIGGNGGTIMKYMKHGCSPGKRVFVTNAADSALNGTHTLGSDAYIDAYRFSLPVAGTGGSRQGAYRCETWSYDPDNDTYSDPQDGARMWLGKDRVDIPGADQLDIHIGRNTGTLTTIVSFWLGPEFNTNIDTAPARWKFFNWRDGPTAQTSGGNIKFEFRLDFTNLNADDAARLDARTYDLGGAEGLTMGVTDASAQYRPSPSTATIACAGTELLAEYRAKHSVWSRAIQHLVFDVPGDQFTDWIACTGVTPGRSTITASTTASGVTTVTTSAAHWYEASSKVTIASDDPALNGVYAIVAVPTSTTFTVACVACGTGTTGTATRHFNQATVLFLDETRGPVRILWKAPFQYDERYFVNLNLELDTSSATISRPGDLYAYFADAVVLAGWTLDENDTDVVRRPIARPAP
jgi:hypothetical protein